LKLLGHSPAPHSPADVKALVATLWPNSWRLGLQFLSGYFSGYANTLICQAALGLAATAEYGLSLQLVSFCTSMALVWTQVKWPLVGQYRTRQDYGGLGKMLRPRLWLQFLTHAVLATGAILFVPGLLSLAGSDKTVLPWLWMGLLAVNALLEMNFSFWTTLISTENRMPFVRPTIIANLCSLALALTLVEFTKLGVRSLVVAPLLAGCVFNYWYWPLEGARSIKTRFLAFVFTPSRQAHTAFNGRAS
jgi:O-antigen/teichoic acid export membrane protein